MWCGFGLLGARDRLGAVQNDGHYLHGEAREDKGLRMYEDRGLGFQGLGGLGRRGNVKDGSCVELRARPARGSQDTTRVVSL